MDVLLEEAESNGVSLDGQPDPTPADVAVQVFLQDQGLLDASTPSSISSGRGPSIPSRPTSARSPRSRSLP